MAQCYFKRFSLFLLFSINIVYGNNINYTDLSQGRMNIGGQLSLPMSYNRSKEFRLSIKAAPYFGYFVANNLEFRFKFSFETNLVFSSLNQVTPPKNWDVSTVLIHYFGTSIMLKPYVGGGLGFKMQDFNAYTSKIFLEIPTGVLLELNRDFAFDLGIPFRWYVSVRSLADNIEFPLVLGFRYVF